MPCQTEPGEQERRDQAAKQERLDAAEAFDIKSQVADGAGGGADQKKNESLMAGMIANIINNLQVTVRNIHLRYEDKLSTPDVSVCPRAALGSRAHRLRPLLTSHCSPSLSTPSRSA